MELVLKRMIYTDESTEGDLFLGEVFECNTLEDTCRNRDKNYDGRLSLDEKVFGKTAIPAGRYEIKMEWSNKFKRKMPHLQNVPYYSGIMIHWGNKAADTYGCILTGRMDPRVPDWISSSQKTYNDLEPKIVAALKDGPLFINIYGGYAS